MTNVPYNLNIPFASNSPSQDQPRMQENTNSLEALITIDHVGFGDNQGGYHKDIHQPILPVGGETNWNPISGSAGRLAVEAAAIAGVQQIFPLNYTPDATITSTDTQLFSLTGKGGISQLTGSASDGNVLPVPTTDGWCWVGGVLIQWGRVTYGVATGGTVTFKDRFPGAIPFPNNLFTVVASETNNLGAVTSASGVYISTNVLTFTKTDFNWSRNTASNVTGFQWIAIGN
jgi:hypothetical protein